MKESIIIDQFQVSRARQGVYGNTEKYVLPKHIFSAQRKLIALFSNTNVAISTQKMLWHVEK